MVSLSNLYAVARFLTERFHLPEDDDDLGSEVLEYPALRTRSNLILPIFFFPFPA